MKTPLIQFSQKVVQRVRRQPILSGITALLALVLVIALVSYLRPKKATATYFKVQRGDFLISVVEGGTLEAVNEVIIRNEVEGTARIIRIVPEGSYAKKGDLLVELDSSAVQDAVNQQQINVEKAQFALVQAEQQYEIQKSTVDSEVDAAKLKVEFAESDLDKYSKGEAKQILRNAQIEITNVLETLKIAEERLKWSFQLYTNGFETKANLDKDGLAVSQGKLKLEQAQQALWMVETFDDPKKRRTLEAALQEAKETLERTKLQGDRKLDQFKADAATQKSTLELSQKKLERDMKQLAATKIYAPQDGLVVYASSGGGGRFSNESMVEEGAVVRNRQELIKLPDIAEMKLQVKIHESHINQIRIGQRAYVVLDSMPDQRFSGFINRVAPLPDSGSRWGNPNLKVYATEILVMDRLPDVKPGVSARAEIVITNLQNVVTVPIQAVTTRKGQQVVFLASAPDQPFPVSVGMYNNKFIQITDGLAGGERVLLSPPLATDEKDLGGSILSESETLSLGDSNKIAAAMARRRTNTLDRVPGVTPPRSQRPGGREVSRGEGNREGSETPGAGPRMVENPIPGAQAGERRSRGAGGEGGAGGTNAAGRAEFMKQFDTNGDGEIDETERAAMPQRRPRGTGGEGGSGGGLGREEMMKQFDTNADGELDETERAAMREKLGTRRRTGGPGGAAGGGPGTTTGPGTSAPTGERRPE